MRPAFTPISQRASIKNVTPVWVDMNGVAAAAGGISPLGMRSAYSSHHTNHQHQRQSHTQAHGRTSPGSSGTPDSSPPSAGLKDHIQGSPRYWGGTPHHHAAGNPSAVTSAFRDMQMKAKEMEEEIQLLKVESADIREKISIHEDRRKERSAKRGEAQLRYTESILSMREAHNSLRSVVADQDVQLLHIDNDTRTIQVDMTQSRRLLASLEDDVIQLRSAMRRLTSENEARQKEFDSVFDQAEHTQAQVDALPAIMQAQLLPMQEAIRNTDEQQSELKWHISQNENQFKAVIRYLRMLVGLNDEICNTVLAREEARDRVLRLSGRVRLPYDPYSGTGGAMPHHALAPSLRGNVDNVHSPAVRVNELTMRAKAVAHSLSAAQQGNYPNEYDNSSSSSGGADRDRNVQGDGMGEQKEQGQCDNEDGDDEYGQEAEAEAEEEGDLDTEGRGKVSFSNLLGALSRTSSHHALESQAEVARHHARLLSQAASGSTAIRVSQPPPLSRCNQSAAGGNKNRSNGSTSSSAGGRGRGRGQWEQLQRRSRGIEYASAVQEMDEMFTPSAEAVARGSGDEDGNGNRGNTDTRMSVRRKNKNRRPGSAPASSSKTVHNYIGVSDRHLLSTRHPSPPGSPSDGFGLALGASYGYEASARAGKAFANGASMQAKKRDVGKPLLNTHTLYVPDHTRRVEYTNRLLRGVRRVELAEQQQFSSQTTYRPQPASAGPINGAWMPGGRAADVVSTNIVANKNKVYRSAKVGLTKVPLNHYNKLHLAEL